MCSSNHLVPGESPALTLGLIRRAAAGDGSAQHALRDRIERVARARATAFIGRRSARRVGVQDVEDLVQQVWLALWRDGGRLLLSYDPARGMSLESFAAMIAQRELWRASSRQRAQKRDEKAELRCAPEELADLAAQDQCPERILGSRELLAHVDAFIRERLSARAQLAYSMLYEDGMAPADVAQALGTDVQSIYNWQHEVRRHARAFMQGQAHRAASAAASAAARLGARMLG